MPPVVASHRARRHGRGRREKARRSGAKVLTSLAGRSAATVARAKAAGMASASDEEIAGADFILSILPPGEALALAQRLAPALTASNAKPVYVDCNAINPATVERVAAAIAPTGCPFVDAGIIGAAAEGGRAPDRASMRPARPRRALPRCANTASTSACLTGR